MPDKETTINDLKKLVQQFIAERDWNQFHSPKNIAMSIAIEAGELMEHFQWEALDESFDKAENPEVLTEIKNELADVMSYVLDFANALDIDLSEAVKDKLKLNAEKYPIEKCKGKSEKYDKL